VFNQNKAQYRMRLQAHYPEETFIIIKAHGGQKLHDDIVECSHTG